MSDRCPACGQILPAARPALHLSPLETRIFELVRQAGANGIDTSAVLERMYAGHPRGAPRTARKSMHVIVNRLNRRLLTHGLTVQGYSHGQGGGTYVLRKINCASSS